MKKTYISPELDLTLIDSLDIITTSDIEGEKEEGVETTPKSDYGGIWSVL